MQMLVLETQQLIHRKTFRRHSKAYQLNHKENDRLFFDHPGEKGSKD